jgi:hypothetical protein
MRPAGTIKAQDDDCDRIEQRAGPDVEPPVGIEPTTCSLRVNRSAD